MTELTDQTKWNFNPITGLPLHKGMHNYKRLFKKPTFSDWVTLAIVILAIVGAFLYVHDTKVCHAVIDNIPQICAQLRQQQLGAASNTSIINFTLLHG